MRLCCILLLLLLVAPKTSAQNILSRYEFSECPMPVPGDLRVDCGRLIVPEDRDQSDTRSIEIAVAIIRSPNPDSQPDPVVFLHGGPGLSALRNIALRRREPYLASRDIILFDQRGGGYSMPALNCPEMDSIPYATLTQNLTLEQAAAYHSQTAQACRDRLVGEGIDLSAYTTADSASDFNDLRLALGYDEINLYGLSYGTRLALTIMRDYPNGVRSVVLDSIYMPPQVDYYADLIPNAASTFRTVFAGCAADAECNAAYPDLESVFLQTIDQLNDEPLRFAAFNPFTNERSEGALNGLAFTGLLYRLLYDDVYIPIVPRVISRIHARDSSFIGDLLFASGAITEPAHYAIGANQSIHCSDEALFTTQTAIDNAAAAIDPRYFGHYHWDVNPRAFMTFCGEWGVRRLLNFSENDSVTSSIPTLILAGEFDPASPPVHARSTAQTLSRSTYIEIRGGGHQSARGTCAAGVVSAFFDNPTAEPDTACLTALRPDYLTDGEFFPTPAFLTRMSIAVAQPMLAQTLQLILFGYAAVFLIITAVLLLLKNRQRRSPVARFALLMLFGLSALYTVFAVLLYTTFTDTSVSDYGRAVFGIAPDSRFILLLPYPLLLLTLGMIAAAVLVWRRRIWSRLRWLVYAATTVIAISMLGFLLTWRLFADL